jgi:hypothetical protein
MFSKTVEDYGGNAISDETRRLGDILVRGKQYMATQEGFEWHGAGDTYVEHYLYHLLGDPTMQMWAAPPQRFDPSKFRGELRRFIERPPGGPPWYIHFELESAFAEGTQVTVLKAGLPIGKGLVHDGSVDVVPEVGTDEYDLSVALNQDGVLPAAEAVEGSGPKPPDPPPPPADTTLSQQCPAQDGSYVVYNQAMTTTGKLQPGFAGAQIVVTYTRPDETTFTKTVTTDANGDWTSTITPSSEAQQPFGTWKIQSRFDGDAGHKPSATTECNVAVVD